MANSIKKNLGFQTVYQILNTCLPLITAPYLARTLGATQLGVFSYTSSIVTYFTLTAMLGTINYGTRSIASVKEDKEKRSRVFCGIYLLQLLTSLFATVIYILYVTVICRENNIIATIQIIALISCFVDISWLFFGMENFKTTVTVSMIFRVITVVGILFLVKDPGDLWIYTVLMLGGVLAGQIILWIYALRYINFVRVSYENIKEHIKPNLLLFVPLLAMSVYHTMDKTMLGIMSNYEQSGFYYNADKLINIPLGVVNGVGTVMLPRMTALYHTGKQREGNQLFIFSTEGVAVISSAMAFGIAAISNEFVPLFFGDGYEPCILLTIVLSPVLIIKGFSSTARTQYLVPLKKERVFTKSVVAGAITNLIINLALIPVLGAMGAVIGTLFAEFVACIWQFLCMQKAIDLKKCLGNCMIYFIAGIVMFVAVRLVARISLSTLVKLVVEIAIGGIVYVIICVLFWKITKNEMYKTVFGDFLAKIPVLRKIL